MKTQDLYYKFLKLTTGETILCITDDDCTNLWNHKTITVADPYVLVSTKIPKNDTIVEAYMMFPWFTFSEDSTIDINTDKILFASTPKKELIEHYDSFIIKDKEESPMDLEDSEILKEVFENNEMEQEDDDSENGRRKTRTIH
jgi:hypothetical protein